MTSLLVDGIRFEFAEHWEAVKWDETPWYRDKIERLQGPLDGRHESTKAVDVLAVYATDAGDVPYLIEVKDFRGFEIEARKRQLAELPLELGLKARDTIAGVLGLVSLGNAPALAARWLAAVHAKRQRVHVVAWIAEDPAPRDQGGQKRAVHNGVRLARVKQKLAWLTARVCVADPLVEPKVPGVAAASTAGAGPARGG